MPETGLVHALLVALAIAFPSLLVVAAIGDIMRYTIPNSLSALLALLAIPAVLVGGGDFVDLLWHLLVGFVVLLLTSILFFRGLFGGGDVKLLTAAALWAGWPLIVPLLVYTALSGGLLAVVLIVLRRVWKRRDAAPAWLNRLFERTSGLPYGVAIAFGGCLTWNRLPIFSTVFPG